MGCAEIRLDGHYGATERAVGAMPGRCFAARTRQAPAKIGDPRPFSLQRAPRFEDADSCVHTPPAPVPLHSPQMLSSVPTRRVVRRSVVAPAAWETERRQGRMPADLPAWASETALDPEASRTMRARTS